MVPEVKNNITKITDACKQYGIESLYLFGSAARVHDYTSESDIDLLYSRFKDDNGEAPAKFDFFDLLWKLEEITGKKVDLVWEQGIKNKYLLKSIMEDRIKLYEA